MDLLTSTYVPFSLALALLAALTLVEMIALLVGASVLGSAEASFPSHSGMDDLVQKLDPEARRFPEVDVLLATIEQLDALSGANKESAPSGLGGFLGLDQSPFITWLGSILFSFGTSGLIIQWLSSSLLGWPVATPIAVALALLLAIWFAHRFAHVFGQLIPRIETSATSIQFMCELRGVVTQGTARRGSPAEVRVRDRQGNVHHMRCEPYMRTEVIHEGTEVLIVRERLGSGRWGLRIVALE